MSLDKLDRTLLDGRAGVAEPVNCVFILNCASKYGSRGLPNKHSHIYFLPVGNYPQFILYQYQEVGQKLAQEAKIVTICISIHIKLKWGF